MQCESAVRHALISIDEVQFAEFEALTAHHGEMAEWLFPKDWPSRREFDSITHDLDRLVYMRDEQEAYLNRLCAQEHACVVAVVSYRLEDRQVAQLQNHGILYFPRLDRAMFAQLRRAVAARRAGGTDQLPAAA
jgi:hypothetical protein